MSPRILRPILAASIVVALLAWVGTESLYASMAEKGSISGQVVDQDGKPIQNLALRLEQMIPMGMEKGGRRSAPVWDSGAVELQGVKIVARTNTDKDGKFSFANLEPGGYTVVGGGKSMGWVYRPLEVEAGKDTALGEIKLSKK